MTDKEQRLEDLLGQLPDHMAFPPTPDIASRIGEILPERQAPGIRRPLVWAAAVAIAAILLIVVLPGPRHAIAGWLGLPGIRIEFVDRFATDEKPDSIGSSLLFGEQTTLADAQATVPFAIALPTRDDLRDPDEVWLRTSADVTAISLLYDAQDDLPQIGDTGVGMLLMEFQTSEEAAFLAKRSMGDGSFSVVTVNGQEGFWLENGELVVLPRDVTLPENQATQSRRSGNVLIWNDGETTFRLETSLDRFSALKIAESLMPYDPDASGNQTTGQIVGRISGGMLAARNATARRDHHETHAWYLASRSCDCAHARHAGIRGRLGHR